MVGSDGYGRCDALGTNYMVIGLREDGISGRIRVLEMEARFVWYRWLFQQAYQVGLDSGIVV